MRQARLTEFESVSGALVDLLDPKLEDVHLHDVAHALAATRRFGAHTRTFYSVAQHSCIVASLLPESERIHGLLHDAPEYATGDMISPMKTALRVIDPNFDRALKSIERGLRCAIYVRAQVELPSTDVVARVKRADLIALATEQRDVMLSPNRWNLSVGPASFTIRPVDETAARLMFLDALAECGVMNTTFGRAAA